MQIHITLIYAAALSLLYVALSVRVIRHRFGTKVSLGDGGHSHLSVAIRTHANFSEYIPLALILLMGVEIMNYPTTLIHAFGIILVIARLSHVVGMAGKNSVGIQRPIGVVTTLGLISICALLILFRSF